MNAKTSLMLALAAGVAAPALAGNDFVQTAQKIEGQIHRAYINVRTGELTLTRPANTRVADFFVWNNHGDGSPDFNFFWGQDSNTRTTTSPAAFGTEAVSFGDIELNSTIDSITIGYYTTNIVDDATPGVDNLGAVWRFYDADGTNNDAAAQEVISITVTSGLPGTTDTVLGAGWFITLDLDSATSFELGDNDGVDFYGNVAGLTGADLDQDGLADFGYSQRFTQNQTGAKGVIGPFLQFGQNHRGNSAIDVDGDLNPDAMTSWGTLANWDWFNGPRFGTGGTYIGFFRFLGNPGPWGSWGLALQGPVAGDASLDLSRDGAFDLGDFFEFFGRYDIAGG